MNLATILIYLLTFFLSLLFIWIAENEMNKKKSNKNFSNGILILCSLVAILIPCILAAVRNISVGMDLRSYVSNNFDFARESNISFSIFLNYMPKKTEVLFAFLIYICAKCFNFQILLFLIQFLIIFPLFITLCLEKEEKNSIFVGMGLFYFLFFNFSLRVFRQSIAMSFLFLAYSFFKKRKSTFSILLSIISILFHSSSLILITLYLVVYILNKSKKKKRTYTLFFLVLTIFFCFYKEIFSLLSGIIYLINPRYSYYLNYYITPNSRLNINDLPISDFILLSSFIVIIIFFGIYTKKFYKINTELLLLSLLGRYFTIFNMIFYESLRIAYFFDYFLLLLIPEINLFLVKDKNNQLIANLTVLIIALIYWIYNYMYLGNYGTNIFIKI